MEAQVLHCRIILHGLHCCMVYTVVCVNHVETVICVNLCVNHVEIYDSVKPAPHCYIVYTHNSEAQVLHFHFFLHGLHCCICCSMNGSAIYAAICCNERIHSAVIEVWVVLLAAI
jgi:hypothetical protein